MKLHAIDSVVEHELSNGASSLGKFTCKDHFDGIAGLADMSSASSEADSYARTLNQLRAQPNAANYALNLSAASDALNNMQAILFAWSSNGSQCLQYSDASRDHMNVVNRPNATCFPPAPDDEAFQLVFNREADIFSSVTGSIPRITNMSFATDLEEAAAPDAQKVQNILAIQPVVKDTSSDIDTSSMLQVGPSVYGGTPSTIISQEAPSTFDVATAQLPSLSDKEMSQLTQALTSSVTGGAAPAATVKVPPTTAWLTAISNALSSGADAYTKMQVAQIAANAKATGKPLTVPSNFANKVSLGGAKSSLSWGWIAGGVGAVVLGAVALAFVTKRK